MVAFLSCPLPTNNHRCRTEREPQHELNALTLSASRLLPINGCVLYIIGKNAIKISATSASTAPTLIQRIQLSFDMFTAVTISTTGIFHRSMTQDGSHRPWEAILTSGLTTPHRTASGSKETFIGELRFGNKLVHCLWKVFSSNSPHARLRTVWMMVHGCGACRPWTRHPRWVAQGPPFFFSAHTSPVQSCVHSDFTRFITHMCVPLKHSACRQFESPFTTAFYSLHILSYFTVHHFDVCLPQEQIALYPALVSRSRQRTIPHVIVSQSRQRLIPHVTIST
jgi:hypothetical protein